MEKPSSFNGREKKKRRVSRRGLEATMRKMEEEAP